MNPATGVETTWEITASTDVRDVSEVLDAVYLADTPLMNRLKWGAPTHNTKIEWISDNIGYGYVVLSHGADLASGTTSWEIGTSGLGAISLAVRQLNSGTILKVMDTDHAAASLIVKGWYVVNNWSVGGTLSVSALSGCTLAEAITDASTLYIVGNAVPEASATRYDKTRPRSLHSNYTQIFRQDVRMSGTRQALAMHAVPNELRHQIMLRAKEHKRQLERTVILGKKEAGAAAAGDYVRLMGGIMDFMAGQSGSHIDATTTAFTETALNNLLAAMWDKGATPNAILTGPARARSISSWERARVRVEQDSHVAGFYTNRYMSDLGWDLEILVSRWCTSNVVFVIDTSKIIPRAMRGRKYLLEKLGKNGDYDEYQLIAEVTLEMRGYTEAQHGMFHALTS